MSNALTTKARVKDRLKITTTNFDDLIDNLIVSITARMEAMTNRQFTLATYTEEIHDGSDFYGSLRGMLITKNAPVGNVSLIEYKAGSNTTPNWTTIDPDDYDVDYDAGLIHFAYGLPRGKRNIRITYTAGWDGYDVGLSSYWNFNVTPTGTVDGSNLTFTLPENASELVVYVDGVRESSANVTFTADTDTFTLAGGRAPYSTISVDYKETLATATGDPVLPAELVDVCERAVIHLFKKRDSEGRSSEGFGESSIVWEKAVFNEEMLATIKNYRRGYYL
ncbi:MAG: hypothetical protein DU489_07070 [Nitrosomonas sp.]|uniref:hypothetical protein n=1 Tax=Nitrosomonas sp. TaxID=42353 RepID=UPI0032EACC1F